MGITRRSKPSKSTSSWSSSGESDQEQPPAFAPPPLPTGASVSSARSPPPIAPRPAGLSSPSRGIQPSGKMIALTGHVEHRGAPPGYHDPPSYHDRNRQYQMAQLRKTAGTERSMGASPISMERSLGASPVGAERTHGASPSDRTISASLTTPTLSQIVLKTPTPSPDSRGGVKPRIPPKPSSAQQLHSKHQYKVSTRTSQACLGWE